MRLSAADTDPRSPAGPELRRIGEPREGDGVPAGAALARPGLAPLAKAASVSGTRMALVHDWLPVYAGAERVLEQMIGTFGQADLFSLFDFLPADQREFLQGKEVTTSFFQRLPFARSKYRNYLPLAPLAIEQFDLRGYEVVVSSSYVVAKGVLTTPDQLHLSYVHSPIRYAWDLQGTYLQQQGIERGLRSTIARLILHYMRLYDVASANRVDAFVANSHHVARRIWKTYRRQAEVLYPPVDTEAFALHETKDDHYVTVSRLVPYKRIDVLVRAFAAMPDRELIVIGDGPDLGRLQAMAPPNVRFLGRQPHEALAYYLRHARGFLFGALEDFGIAPVEAMACGTPVVAFGRGGALETVRPGETGLFFDEQTPAAVAEAVEAFEALRPRLSAERIRLHAEDFSEPRFRSAFHALVEREYARFHGR